MTALGCTADDVGAEESGAEAGTDTDTGTAPASNTASNSSAGSSGGTAGTTDPTEASTTSDDGSSDGTGPAACNELVELFGGVDPVERAENMIADADGNLYVGTFRGDALDQGRILRVQDPCGAATVTTWADQTQGIAGPVTGLQVAGDYLLACNGPFIRTLSLADGSLAASHGFEPDLVDGVEDNPQCGDMTVDAQGNVYVGVLGSSDAYAGVYRLDAAALTTDGAPASPWANHGSFPELLDPLFLNGLVYDDANDSLLVLKYGTGQLVRLGVNAAGAWDPTDSAVLVLDADDLTLVDGMRLRSSSPGLATVVLAQNQIPGAGGANPPNSGRVVEITVDMELGTGQVEVLAPDLDFPTTVVLDDEDVWVLEGRTGELFGSEPPDEPPPPIVVRRIPAVARRSPASSP